MPHGSIDSVTTGKLSKNPIPPIDAVHCTVSRCICVAAFRSTYGYLDTLGRDKGYAAMRDHDALFKNSIAPDYH